MSDCRVPMVTYAVPCPHESHCIDESKSYCEPWGRWTNCREVGHCTYDGSEEEKDESDDDES